MAFSDSPPPAKTAGLIVLVALAVLVFLHRGFAGVDVRLG